MKNNAIRMFLTLGAACLGVSALDAQSSNEMLTAKVPFAFHVRGESFAAGRYVVRGNGFMSVPSIHNATTGQTVFVAGSPNAQNSAHAPKMVFHCYAGKTCFLSEIQSATGMGTLVGVSKEEKAILKGEAPREVAAISVPLQSGQ